MTKSETEIINTFMSLLQNKSLLDITNDDIIKHSSISKRTFYNYFSNSNDILKVIQEIIDNRIMIPYTKVSNKFSLDDITNILQIFNLSIELVVPIILENKDFLIRLNNAKLSYIWKTPFFHIYDEGLNKSGLNKNSTIISKLLCSYLTNLIETWLINMPEISEKEFKIRAFNYLEFSFNDLLRKKRGS